MCNDACINFVAAAVNAADIMGKDVLESGAFNVNGSTRPIFERLYCSSYVGTDIQNGPGVDVICDAENLVQHFGVRSFDVLVSTEVLEHVRNWRSVISNYKRILRPNGLMIITTRSKGFFYHGYPEDHWRYEPDDMQRIFSDFEILLLQGDPSEPGVFLKARRPVKYKETKLTGIELYSINSERRTIIMQGAAPASPHTGVPGWLTNEEENVLIEYARQYDGGVIVNIGVEFGRSMSDFVKFAPAAKVYGIEIKPLDHYTDNLKEAGLVPPNLIVGNSADPAVRARVTKSLKGKGIDLLFIDGGHAFEEATADLQQWTPLVRIGGTVLIHDTATPANQLPHPLHFEVSRAVTTWLNTEGALWKTIKAVNTLLVLERIEQPTAERET